MATNIVRKVELGSDVYDISAGYLRSLTDSTKEYTLEDILALHNLEIRVVSTLPTASADTMNAIYLVPQSRTGEKNIKDEYITVHDAAQSPAYFWEKIGSTEVDLSNYVTKGTYNGTAAEDGAHTHTVSGSVTVPTVSKTDKHLDVSVTPVAVAADGTADALTGVKVSSTDNALGEATTFAVTPTTADSSKMVVTSVNSATATAATASKATAQTAVLRGSADVGSAVSIPNVTANANVTIPNVTGNVASNAITVASTGGTAFATFTPEVDANGVLSFDFTSKNYTTSDATKTTLGTALTATNTTLGTAISVTPAVTTTNKITPYTFADVDCSLVSTTPVAVATGELAATGTGGSVVTAAIKNVSVAANKNDVVAAATGVAANGTAAALTGVKVSTQPVASLSDTGSTGIAFVSAVTVGSTSASLANGAAAENGKHTHTTSVTL